MGSNRPLTNEERLEIVELLKRGSLSHREIGKRVNRAQSTISQIARDAGITPTHRRKRTPAARELKLESTYDREKRIVLEDSILGVLHKMVDDGGHSPRDMRELTQATKVALDARRSEDIAPEEEESRTLVPMAGMGEMAYDPNTAMGRELLKLEAELEATEE